MSRMAEEDLTFDEWMAGETTSPVRHEFVGGRAFAMAGGTERHDLMAGFAYEDLAPGARARGCRPFFGNRVLRVPTGNAYYPDVMVVCGRAAHETYEEDAALIVEVRSPSTAGVDRREKATAYAALPGLVHLILIDPVYRQVERARFIEHRVAGWEQFVDGHVVFTPYGDLDVSSLYDRVEATASS